MTAKQVAVKLSHKKAKAAKMMADLKQLKDEIKQLNDELKALKAKEGDQKKTKAVSKKKK